jgi:hypothetical protein
MDDKSYRQNDSVAANLYREGEEKSSGATTYRIIISSRSDWFREFSCNVLVLQKFWRVYRNSTEVPEILD